MIECYSKALDQAININRYIGKIDNGTEGPTVVIFAGIHGNETAGVFALDEVFKSINKEEVKGALYGITGNLNALKERQRFIDVDLNRIWTEKELIDLENSEFLNQEQHEQKELFEILNHILETHEPPFYFLDLHTTSSRSLPFITINDALINRKFSQQFPVPIVLGIEEYLNGPLLSYINTLGYVSLGFESGQHDDKSAISNAIAFIRLALHHSQSLNQTKDELQPFYRKLKRYAHNLTATFEITYLHAIKNGEVFKMRPDFESFQKIMKHTLLAESDGKQIRSDYNARIFMPLYQEKGREGFFIIRKIEPFFLKLSSALRKLKADSILVVLPGVRWYNGTKGALEVNLKVARFLAKPIFHLLGYRSRQIDATHLRVFNRERVAKIKSYRQLSWYKKTASH